MKTILGELSTGDRFNIITFSTTNIKWQPTLVDASIANVNAARQFVDSMQAVGGARIVHTRTLCTNPITGTNLNDALTLALADVASQQQSSSTRSAIVVLLVGIAWRTWEDRLGATYRPTASRQSA
jgi:hypothetical protein